MPIILISRKVKFFIVIIAFFHSCNVLSATEFGEWLDEPVSLDFQNESYQKVLNEISQQTGITIIFDENLAKEKTTCNVSDIRVIDVISRIFKGKNKIIQTNKGKKIVIIETFGASSFISSSNSSKQDLKPPMPEEELTTLHEQQKTEIIARTTNNDEILADGTTLGELRAIHKHQSIEIKNRLNNRDELIENGITLRELNKLHDKQNLEIQSRLINEDSLVDKGITLRELRELHNKEYTPNLEQNVN